MKEAEKRELFKEYYAILLSASVDSQTASYALDSDLKKEAKRMVEIALMHVESVEKGLERISQE